MVIVVPSLSLKGWLWTDLECDNTDAPTDEWNPGETSATQAQRKMVPWSEFSNKLCQTQYNLSLSWLKLSKLH